MEIPKNLKGMRFNRVRFKDKRAFENGWQNKPYGYSDISKFFPKENYGVMCGMELRALDDDTPDKKLIKLFLDNFGITFRVRDHLYFNFDNRHSDKIIFYEPTGEHMGELQGEGTYVVGAGSTHPSGEIYKVKDYTEIQTISYEKFIEVFKDYIKSKVTSNPNKEKRYNPQDDDLIKQIKEKWNDGDRQNLTLSVAGYLRKEKRLGLPHTLEIIEKICNDCGDTDFNERKRAVEETYNKDEGEIKGFTGLKERDIKTKNSGAIFTIEGQVENFIEHQPIFYDRAGIWMMWSHEKTRWELTDEVDILNGIKKDGADTINSKLKNEIVNALKQMGRENMPKNVENNWIQFRDKIVDLTTDETFEATPKYFITNPIPYKIGESEDTPTLDKYFKEWVVSEGLQDETYVDTLYEIIAYSCMSKQFLQRLFTFVGSGSNGKGVYLSIVKKFLGEDNCCSTELKMLATSGFESSALYKKQACFMGEVDAYDMQNTNLIKKLSGEDDIRYCFKGKTPFTEKSATTCFMNTNSLPVTPDKSKGFYRRWLIIDFPHEFPVGKDILAEISEQEFENLAKKCIRIAKELIERKKFTNEGDLDTRIRRYEDRSNPLMRFIEDHCEEEIDIDTPLQEFAKELNNYLKDNRLRKMTVKRISRSLKEEGFDISRLQREINGKLVKTNCITGIGLSRTTKDYINATTPPQEKSTEFHSPTTSNHVQSDNFDELEAKYKQEGLL